MSNYLKKYSPYIIAFCGVIFSGFVAYMTDQHTNALRDNNTDQQIVLINNRIDNLQKEIDQRDRLEMHFQDQLNVRLTRIEETINQVYMFVSKRITND